MTTSQSNSKAHVHPSTHLQPSSGTNGEFKRLLDADSARPLSGAFLLAAGFTGLAEAMVFTPIDLCKVRCQVQYGREAALSPWGVAKQLVREHGVMRGLYTGAGPTMLRDFVGNAFYFACYELAKRALLARGAAREWGETPVFVLSGGIAGCAYWAGALRGFNTSSRGMVMRVCVCFMRWLIVEHPLPPTHTTQQQRSSRSTRSSPSSRARRAPRPGPWAWPRGCGST